ncbi:MAG: Nudix family hydrolase [Pseudomonadota bacterium]|nr:Nudix family hydrolase [Pseudomonadota bacterium]
MSLNSYIDIAIGVLQKETRICLSLRQQHQSHANHWEFPGGKIEQGETPIEALKREFLEELAVETHNWQPLIVIPWDYEKVSVRLHVYTTDEYASEPIGNEGQLVKWFDIADLHELTFPAANKGVLMALQLADKYMITGKFCGKADALQKLSSALESGVELCQLRAKDLESNEFSDIAEAAISLCHTKKAKILLNGKVNLLAEFPEADGIQLASNLMYDFKTRPIAKNKLLGVSTHTDEDIKQALKIDADFILLSPVKETSSHPGVAGIGWKTFADNVESITVPVYALGGMQEEDVEMAKLQGGHGVAAISGFWPG